MLSLTFQFLEDDAPVEVPLPQYLEVTELADGGYYFAPPGDFSKVDFSACRELGESVNLDATLNRMGFTPFDAGRYAKPALPSLMTEAGGKYRGLGFCDAC